MASRSFALFLTDLNDGQTLAGLTGDMTELLQTVQSTGRSGSLTLKVKVAPASKGGQHVDKITITAERKLELPKPEAPSDFFWLTDEAEMSRQHPRQQSLELREASPPDADGVITLKEVSQ